MTIPETTAYTYQRIVDTAQVMAAFITAVLESDGEALGVRGKQLLSAASKMAGIAAWVATDRRDALAPAAADETKAHPLEKTQGVQRKGQQ